MKKESTKLVKKKLELKKSTIAKFGMNEGELRMIVGGINDPKESGDGLSCTSSIVNQPK
jgi:hypothetical protein